MLKKLLLATALLLGATQAFAAAKTLAVRCDGCTPTQKRSLALAQNVQTNANVYVMSIKPMAQTMVGYYVYRADQPNALPDGPAQVEVGVAAPIVGLKQGSAQKAGGGTLWSEPLAVTALQMTKFQAYANAYLTLTTLKDDIMLDNNVGYDSISDIANCVACGHAWVMANAARIANTVAAWDFFRAQDVELSVSINGVVTGGYDPELTFRLRMTNDVGRETGYCTGVLGANGMEVDVTKCTDSDGNPIPSNAAAFFGNVYSFVTQNDLNEWLTLADLYGIPINPGGVVTVGEIGRFDCRVNPCKGTQESD